MSFKERADNIKRHVKLIDVMSDAGHVPEGKPSDDFQLSCPFHGTDQKASAHVYPDEHFHCFTCGRHYDVISYFAEVANTSPANAMFLLEKKYSIPKLKGIVYEKLVEEKETKEFSLSDEFTRIEQMIVRNKLKYGREKFAKMLFVLDDALRNKKPENMAKLREKI